MSNRSHPGKPSAPKLASRRLLQQFGVHPTDREAVTLNLSGATALCIATNHGVLDIGVATGVFASELTVPHYGFLDANMRVDLASPRGGIVPVEPLSMKEPIRTPQDDRMLDDEVFRAMLMNSRCIADLDSTAYDIIYFAGGWGAAFDLGQSETLGRKVSEAYAAGRVIGGICHGPLGLLRARRPDGELLVKGRRVTAPQSRHSLRDRIVDDAPLLVCRDRRCARDHRNRADTRVDHRWHYARRRRPACDRTRRLCRLGLRRP